MQVIVIKDGTVPVAIAKVVATDAEDFDVQKHIEAEDVNRDAHSFVESFTVPDDSRYIGVGWDEFNGFQVFGYLGLNEALAALNEFASDEEVAGSNQGDGHWCLTYDPGDDEAYGHVFTL